MTWTVKLSEKALKQLGKLNKPERELVWRFINNTLPNLDNPRSHGKALQGNFKGLWRYRVGNYRIVSQIKDDVLMILVVKIGHRKNIYK